MRDFSFMRVCVFHIYTRTRSLKWKVEMFDLGINKQQIITNNEEDFYTIVFRGIEP